MGSPSRPSRRWGTAWASGWPRSSRTPMPSSRSFPTATPWPPGPRGWPGPRMWPWWLSPPPSASVSAGSRPAARQPDPDALIVELPDGHTLAARAWRVDGLQYVDLVSLATALGLRLDWDPALWGYRLRPRAAPQGQDELTLLPERVYEG